MDIIYYHYYCYHTHANTHTYVHACTPSVFFISAMFVTLVFLDIWITPPCLADHFSLPRARLTIFDIWITPPCLADHFSSPRARLTILDIWISPPCLADHFSSPRARLTIPHFLLVDDGDEVSVVAKALVRNKTRLGPFEAHRTETMNITDTDFVLKVCIQDRFSSQWRILDEMRMESLLISFTL